MLLCEVCSYAKSGNYISDFVKPVLIYSIYIFQSPGNSLLLWLLAMKGV